MSPYSKAALEKQQRLAQKEAAGESPTWMDLAGLLEPNPELPLCSTWNVDGEVQCQRTNHHEPPHRAVLEW